MSAFLVIGGLFSARIVAFYRFAWAPNPIPRSVWLQLVRKRSLLVVDGRGYHATGSVVEISSFFVWKRRDSRGCIGFERYVCGIVLI